MRIDSPKNPRIVALARAIARGEVVSLEGERLLGEALDAGVVPSEVFFLAEADARLLERARELGAGLVEVGPRVLEKLSDLPSTRGVVATAEIPARTLPSISIPENGLAVALDGVQDPSNVGAILRSAEAFGAVAALLMEGCASPFAPRALRSSAGSSLRLPVATDLSADEVFGWARTRGVTLVGADAHRGEEVPRRSGRMLLVIGSEGRGLSSGLCARLDVRITIPIAPAVESLNAAVAAGILLYALTR
jgi:TrmH family RNA methyltransferase